MKKLLILFTCLATLCHCSNEKETAPYSCSGDQELIDGVGYTVNTVSITDDCNDNTIDSKTYCVCKETHDYIQSTFIQSPFGQPCEILEFSDINGVNQSGYIRAWGRGLCSLYEGYD